MKGDWICSHQRYLLYQEKNKSVIGAQIMFQQKYKTLNSSNAQFKDYTLTRAVQIFTLESQPWFKEEY